MLITPTLFRKEGANGAILRRLRLLEDDKPMFLVILNAVKNLGAHCLRRLAGSLAPRRVARLI